MAERDHHSRIADANRIYNAINFLNQAARELYLVGSPDCIAFGEQIDKLLSHDNGECGLIPLAEKISKK